MIRAMEVGLPVYVENQLLQTKGAGEGIHISSLSIPIKAGAPWWARSICRWRR